MSKIYCGNNALSPELKKKGVKLGNRYRCLQKGVGRGIHQPYDPLYKGAYRPIDSRKMYCGNSKSLPDDYDLFGNLPQCLQKGVGIGKRQKAEQKSKKKSKFSSNFILKRDNRKFIPISIFIVLSILIFTILYMTKPDFLCVKDEDNVKHINKVKF